MFRNFYVPLSKESTHVPIAYNGETRQIPMRTLYEAVPKEEHPSRAHARRTYTKKMQILRVKLRQEEISIPSE